MTERIRNENFKTNKDKMNVSMALKPTLMIQLNLFPNCVQFQDPHMDQNVYSCNANPHHPPPPLLPNPSKRNINSKWFYHQVKSLMYSIIYSKKLSPNMFCEFQQKIFTSQYYDLI